MPDLTNAVLTVLMEQPCPSTNQDAEVLASMLAAAAGRFFLEHPQALVDLGAIVDTGLYEVPKVSAGDIEAAARRVSAAEHANMGGEFDEENLDEARHELETLIDAWRWPWDRTPVYGDSDLWPSRAPRLFRVPGLTAADHVREEAAAEPDIVWRHPTGDLTIAERFLDSLKETGASADVISAAEQVLAERRRASKAGS